MSAAGTQIAQAVWLIKNGAASCASVQIENQRVGRTVLWNNTLAANRWIRFISETQRVEVSDDSGSTWTKSQSGTVGVIPYIEGGVNNQIVITGPTTGTYNVTYTARG